MEIQDFEAITFPCAVKVQRSRRPVVENLAVRAETLAQVASAVRKIAGPGTVPYRVLLSTLEGHAARRTDIGYLTGETVDLLLETT